MRRSSVCAALLFAGAPALGAPPSLADRTVVARVVTTWNESCDGGTRGDWDNMVKGWYSHITSGHGSKNWVAKSFQSDGLILDNDFVDPDLQSWGNDVNKLDNADAAMVGLHGADNGPDHRWVGIPRVDLSLPGDGGNCYAYQAQMALGDGDLEFFHLSSCRSMDREDWYPNWASTFKGVHQIDGFHGLMYISSYYVDDYEDFADDSFDYSIAGSWLDAMFHERGLDWDQCPVARGVGVGSNGEADAFYRLDHERYTNVFSDPTKPTFHAVYYLEGCWADGEGQLPKSGGPAQPEKRAEEGPPPLDRTAMTLDEYKTQVDGALPVFTTLVLAAPAGRDWIRDETPATIAAAVDDPDVPELVTTVGSLTEARDVADTKVIKIDLGRNRVRYINRSRGFDWATSPHTAHDPNDALAKVQAAAEALGIPASEVDPNDCCQVDTVVGNGFRLGNTDGTPDSTLQAERMVTLERKINGLPVLASSVRGSVSNQGQVARLHARWPRFNLPEGLTLRPRQEVIDELAARIQRSEQGAAVQMYIVLAYAPVGDHFLPVAHASIADALSAEEIDVPLVQGPADADLDGVPDPNDVCVGDNDPGQQDTDLDGVGDACDNCPDTDNLDQADSDEDGIGNACEVPVGACTTAGGSCDVMGQALCSTGGGVYGGDGSTCSQSEPVRAGAESAWGLLALLALIPTAALFRRRWRLQLP